MYYKLYTKTGALSRSS